MTAAYDLNRQRLLDLAAAVPPEWLEVVVHRHTPMFHSEYCLFCGCLSSGKNRPDCGRPCERHEVRLRDRLGVEHPLLADSQCRNTLFHAEAESLLEIMPSLQERGVRHFRVELLAENSREEVRRTLAAYQRLAANRDSRQTACGFATQLISTIDDSCEQQPAGGRVPAAGARCCGWRFR